GAPGPISGGQATGPSATSKAFFYSPSGNLGCEMMPTAVVCTSRKPPHRVTLKPSGELTDLCIHSTRTVDCGGDFDEDAKFRELPYGRSLTLGPFRCSSATTGITCVIAASGRGFLINRDTVQRVG